MIRAALVGVVLAFATASCGLLSEVSPESAADAVAEGCRALLDNTAVDAPSERVQRARLVCAYFE